MDQAIPTQHPAVVLRSHYNHLRALLAAALIALVGLTVAVVILATNDDGASTSSAPAATAVDFRLPSHARIARRRASARPLEADAQRLGDHRPRALSVAKPAEALSPYARGPFACTG